MLHVRVSYVYQSSYLLTCMTDELKWSIWQWCLFLTATDHQHDRRLNIRLHHYAAAAADYDDDDDALTSPGPYDTHDPVGL